MGYLIPSQKEHGNHAIIVFLIFLRAKKVFALSPFLPSIIFFQNIVLKITPIDRKNIGNNFALSKNTMFDNKGEGQLYSSQPLHLDSIGLGKFQLKTIEGI